MLHAIEFALTSIFTAAFIYVALAIRASKSEWKTGLAEVKTEMGEMELRLTNQISTEGRRMDGQVSQGYVPLRLCRALHEAEVDKLDSLAKKVDQLDEHVNALRAERG